MNFKTTNLQVGTVDIPDALKVKTILCLYKDGTWTTGLNIKEGWVVMVNVPSRLSVCVQEYHGKYCFRDGFYWHLCDDSASGDWLVVNNLFSVYFGNETALTDDDEVIGRILLENYAYIDNFKNVEIAK